MRIALAISALVVIGVAAVRIDVPIAPRLSNESIELVRTQGCPQQLRSAAVTIDEALRAARERAINGKTIESQGRTYRLTEKNTPVIAVQQLQRAVGSPAPIASALIKLAERRCGRTAAAAAWAVVFSVPLAAMASNSSIVVFVVRSGSGIATF